MEALEVRLSEDFEDLVVEPPAPPNMLAARWSAGGLDGELAVRWRAR